MPNLSLQRALIGRRRLSIPLSHGSSRSGLEIRNIIAPLLLLRLCISCHGHPSRALRCVLRIGKADTFKVNKKGQDFPPHLDKQDNVPSRASLLE